MTDAAFAGERLEHLPQVVERNGGDLGLAVVDAVREQQLDFLMLRNRWSSESAFSSKLVSGRYLVKPTEPAAPMLRLEMATSSRPDTNCTLSQSRGSWAEAMQNSPEVAISVCGGTGESA